MGAESHAAAASERDRALAILRRHGRDTVSFQGLESDFRYWFSGDGFVAYVDVGGAWVAGGGPVGEVARLRALALDFAAAARLAGRRACFFGAERELVAAIELPHLLMGEQPVWDPARWDEVLAGASSLRYQLRRARGRGVVVRAIDDGVDGGDAAARRRAVEALAARWQAEQAMAPMRFLVQLEPFSYTDERVHLVAEQGGEVVGFLSAIPVYARRRLFIEDILRSPASPNGTVELLIDAAMRAAAARGDREVTLGLAPLAGPVARGLRLARTVSTPLYDFRGLRAFKAKLRPHAWEPVYLCAAPEGSILVALRDSLAAFAGGSLVGFGLRTLLRPRWRLAVIAALGVAAAGAAAAWWLW